MQRAWLILPAFSLGACLFAVADVVSDRDGSSGGGDASIDDVAIEGWPGGAGGLEAGGQAGADAQGDVVDAPSEVASDAEVTWSSCKALGYAGSCVGTATLLYYATQASCGATTTKCYVNDCALEAGLCKYQGPGACGGNGCEHLLDPAQVEHCSTWNTGKCRGNTVIKADPKDPTNCLYRDCGAQTCSTDAGMADCF